MMYNSPIGRDLKKEREYVVFIQSRQLNLIKTHVRQQGLNLQVSGHW
jgi:hypothetical protein